MVAPMLQLNIYTVTGALLGIFSDNTAVNHTQCQLKQGDKTETVCGPRAAAKRVM